MTANQAKPGPSRPQTLEPGAEAIERAATLIRQGKIVAIPTETVYGLAVDAANEDAVQALYVAKGRPEEKPFVVQFGSVEAARAWCSFEGPAARLAKALWPGPLTLIVRKPDKAALASRITAGGDTIGIRIPDNEIALGVLAAVGGPVAVTSANLSGEAGARAAGEIAPSLKAHLALILDGGPCPLGVASTVIDTTGHSLRILRQGTLSATDIEKVLEP
jgi:L-threonylcarbamoyladenylate synthase